MYSISTVYYGVPYTERLNAYNMSKEAEENDELENLGFDLLYHGGGVDFPPGYLGVQVGEWDECESYLHWHEFLKRAGFPEGPRGPVDAEIVFQAHALYDTLSPRVKALLAEDGITEPGLYVVWSTS